MITLNAMRLRVWIVGIVTAGCLTACSDSPRQMVAVAVKDGQPTIVLVACSKTFTSVDIETRAGFAPQWREIHAAKPDRVTDVPFFQLPTGWSADSRLNQGVAPLTELTPAMEYEVRARTKSAYSYGVSFTVADLATLGSSQVLYSSPGGTTTLTSRSNFIARAERDCGQND